MDKHELAITFKRLEIEALEKTRMKSQGYSQGYRDYWGGKAAGFADAWAYTLWGHINMHPKAYNLANESYSKLANK